MYSSNNPLSPTNFLSHKPVDVFGDAPITFELIQEKIQFPNLEDNYNSASTGFSDSLVLTP